MILFLTVWIVIGNGFALAGMSGGPVFYDLIYGAGRFSDRLVARQAAAPRYGVFRGNNGCPCGKTSRNTSNWSP